MNNRTEELTAAAEAFLECHRQWQDSNDRPAVDGNWIDGMENLFQSFSEGDMPDNCRELEEAVQSLSDAYEADEQSQFLSKPERMTRTWAAIQAIEVKAKACQESKQRRPIESMKMLAAQNVAHEQIARMHGLVDDAGHGKYWLVEQELSQAGSVMGSDGFPKAEFLPRPTEPKHRTAKKMTRRADKTEDKPCPESPRELWQQGVSEAQAAKMLHKSEAAVKELYESFDDELANGPSEETTTKILELAGAGLDAAKISKKVDCTKRVVESVVKRGKREVANN